MDIHNGLNMLDQHNYQIVQITEQSSLLKQMLSCIYFCDSVPCCCCCCCLDISVRPIGEIGETGYSVYEKLIGTGNCSSLIECLLSQQDVIAMSTSNKSFFSLPFYLCGGDTPYPCSRTPLLQL